MISPSKQLLLLVAVFTVSILIPESSDARGRSKTRSKTEWDKSASECFQIFEEFDMVPKEQVAQCVAIWAAYNSSEKMRASQRFVLVKAFSFLFDEGNAAQSWLAYNALRRLGEAPERKDQSMGSGANVGTPAPIAATVAPKAVPVENREFYDPPTATKGQHKRARAKNGKGAKQEKRKQYDAALTLYEQAIELNPRYETALYNAARMYARLGNLDSAARYLHFLGDLGTEDASRYLHKARVSSDFRGAKDHQGYKDVTGFARIKLLNGKGVYGEDEIERIEEYFEGAFYSVEESSLDPHDREFPVIWHKDGTARNTAFILSKLVNHPQTMLVPIDWNTEYDIVVTWGDTFELDPRNGQPIVREYEMKNPDDATENALYEQDKALREPEKYARKVDKTAKTPDRMINQGESGVRRVENTVNVIEKTGKTLESGGGLLK